MVLVDAIFANTITAEHTWNLHISFVILLACHLEEMFGIHRLDINAIVFRRYNQFTIVFILNQQNKRKNNSIVCLTANEISDARDATW